MPRWVVGSAQQRVAGRFALDWFVGYGGAAKLDAMHSAATGGFTCSWFCPEVGFATARFALDFWLAALIAAHAGDATVTLNCLQSVLFIVIVMLSLWSLLWFLVVAGTEKFRILALFVLWSRVSG